MLSQEAFEILGISQDADRQKIRHAYAEKSKMYHVETHPEEFARLREAYETVLSQANSSVPFSSSSPFQQTPIKQTYQTFQPEDNSSPPASGTEENTTLYDVSDSHADDAGAGQKEIDTPYAEALEALFSDDLNINNFQELTQLIYHKCRCGEDFHTSGAIALSTKDSNIKQEPIHIESILWENRPFDTTLFLGSPWQQWKCMDWLPLLCHPHFLQKQYDTTFLKELRKLLRKEMLNSPDGIGKDLFHFLCLAYGFFLRKDQPQDACLKEIEETLSLHPCHREYVQEIIEWTSLQSDYKFTILCQKAFAFSQGTLPFEESHGFPKIFLNAVEVKLLWEPNSQNDFIFQNLTYIPGLLFSQELPKRKQEQEQNHAYQEECFQGFLTMWSLYEKETGQPIPEHALTEYCYQTNAERLVDFKHNYFTGRNLKEITGGAAFTKAFENWMFSKDFILFENRMIQRDRIILPHLAYDLWKELCTWFQDSTPYAERLLNRLKNEDYFVNYEKRYQRELVWHKQRIAETYLKELLPLPALTQKRLELLHIVEQGTTANLGQVDQILRSLYRYINTESAQIAMTRITNALTRFCFLVTNPSFEKDPVPGDIFAFLEDQVILYRKKENLTCRLSHAVFYDWLSSTIDSMAGSNLSEKKPVYSDEFIETVCKNMYCYRSYIDCS